MLTAKEIRSREFEEGSPSGPDSFCTVIDSNAIWDGLLCIYSIRQFHDQPIYVICDDYAKTVIEMQKIPNVHTRASITNESNTDITDGVFGGGFVSHNENWDHYHPISILFRKPDAMDFAFEDCNDTLFTDCDVYFIRGIKERLDSDVGLVPTHVYYGYSKEHRAAMEKKFGMYTAGYVWTSRKDFTEWWRDSMISDSEYYDQECLCRAGNIYNVKHFRPPHHIIANNFDYRWKTYDEQYEVVDNNPHRNMKELGWEFNNGLRTHLGTATSMHFHIDPGSVYRRGQVVDQRGRMMARIFLLTLVNSALEEHKNILKFYTEKIRRHITPFQGKDGDGKVGGLMNFKNVYSLDGQQERGYKPKDLVDA